MELRDNKQISRETHIELAEIVLKNNIFEFDENRFKQVHGTTIATKFKQPYAIIMTHLEENTLVAFKEKPIISWSYIDNIFFIWEHGEESTEKFLNKLSSFHPTMKFTASTQKKQLIF